MFNNKVFSSMRVLLVLWYVIVCARMAAGARCKPRIYVHNAMQTDTTGRRCWGEVEIKSCWGYCLSYEISDWQFPFKKSTHPVCMHGDRKPASARLANCDPGVQPGTENYHFVEAENCKCQACRSEDTSCEWIPSKSSLLDDLIFKEEYEQETMIESE